MCAYRKVCAYKRVIYSTAHFSICKVDTDIVAISTSFEGTISAKSKYKPVNQGFEKYWKSKESTSRTSYDPRICISPLRYRYDLWPWWSQRRF